MAQKNTNKKQVSNSNKDRKGDTGRTSNQVGRSPPAEARIITTEETEKAYKLLVSHCFQVECNGHLKEWYFSNFFLF